MIGQSQGLNQETSVSKCNALTTVSQRLFSYVKPFVYQKYSALQKNWTFWGFPYKMTRGAKVENHLKVMLNPPIFSQMLVLMWEADQ